MAKEKPKTIYLLFEGDDFFHLHPTLEAYLDEDKAREWVKEKRTDTNATLYCQLKVVDWTEEKT